MRRRFTSLLSITGYSALLFIPVHHITHRHYPPNLTLPVLLCRTSRARLRVRQSRTADLAKLVPLRRPTICFPWCTIFIFVGKVQSVLSIFSVYTASEYNYCFQQLHSVLVVCILKFVLNTNLRIQSAYSSHTFHPYSRQVSFVPVAIQRIRTTPNWL